MLKNVKIVIIGDDGQPVKNEDGTLNIIDLYRGSTSKDEHTVYLKDKAKKLVDDNNILIQRINSYELEDKKRNVLNIFKEKKIDDSFFEILKIDYSKDIKNISEELDAYIKTNPKILKIENNTGGVKLTIGQNIKNNDDSSIQKNELSGTEIL